MSSSNETAGGRVLNRIEYHLLYGNSRKPFRLNENWQLLTISNAAGHMRGRAWLIQERVEGEWRDRFMIRTASAVRDLVAARIGPIDADAAAILAALPAGSTP